MLVSWKCMEFSCCGWGQRSSCLGWLLANLPQQTCHETKLAYLAGSIWEHFAGRDMPLNDMGWSAVNRMPCCCLPLSHCCSLSFPSGPWPAKPELKPEIISVLTKKFLTCMDPVEFQTSHGIRLYIGGRVIKPASIACLSSRRSATWGLG